MLQYNLLERNCIRIVRSGVRASLLLNCPEQDTPNNWPHSNSTDPGYSKTSGGRRERLCGCPALSLGPGFDVAGIRPVRGCVRSYINFPSNLRPAPDCLSFRLVSSLEALAPFEKETSVTALSDAVSYTFLLPMKFQVSGPPAVLPHSRTKLRGVSVLRSQLSAPAPEQCPIHRQINELRPFSVRICK